MARVDATLSTAIAAMSQNTTTGPRKYAVAAAMAAEAALPAWLNASLRPTRRAKARGPTIPSVTAATAGANTAPAAPESACNAATGQNPGAKGMATEASVIATAAATIRARLARVPSISAPAGVWAKRPAIPPTDSTTPIAASSQRWTVSR